MFKYDKNKKIKYRQKDEKFEKVNYDENMKKSPCIINKCLTISQDERRWNMKNRTQHQTTPSDSAVSILHSSSSFFKSRLRARAMQKMFEAVLFGSNHGHHKATKSGSSTARNKLDAAPA